MTPKEKAIELVEKFIPPSLDRGVEYWVSENIAKHCALIAVDEIIEALCDYYDYPNMYIIDWWKQVKQEIEKL